MLLTLFLICVTFGEISSECHKGFMTICDDFKDLQNHPNPSSLKEVLIGSPNDQDHSNLTIASLMDDLPLDSLTHLTRLVVNRKLKGLEKRQFAYQCTYYNTPLKYVTFYGNELKEITPLYFPVAKLKRMSLVNNKIERMAPWAFKVHDIEEFDASDNLIDVIEYEALPLSEETKIIVLRNNRISHIEPKSFTPSLVSLDLDKNELRFIQDGVLNDLVNIRDLRLSHNKFTKLPDIAHMTEMVAFDISHNDIETIKAGVFDKMPSLQYLNLKGNQLSDSRVLDAITTPRTINLALNRFRKLEFPAVANQTLVLYGNAFDCRTWDKFTDQLKGFGSKCDSTFWNSGLGPYCINYGQEPYPFTSQWELDIDRYMKAVIEVLPTFKDCLLDPDRSKFLFSIKSGCVA